MAIILRSIHKKFPTKEVGQSVTVIDNVDLDVPDGKVVALFGPNGCGKTTLLSIISGIEQPDSGEASVKGDGADRPTVGFAFQNFREVLLPWKSASDNVAFGLFARGIPKAEAREKAEAFLDDYGFAIPRTNYSYQLSVGQQQSVALARVLILNPANLLLDEPFSALDHDARLRMRDFVVATIRKAASAVVLVSHDIDEALYMSDEIYLLSRGPARVLHHFPIPFARPRSFDLLTSHEFSDLRREVLAAFLKEVAS